MFFRVLVGAVVVLHFAFIAFVIFGGLLVLWRRWVLWVHLPAFVWGFLIEFCDWKCPLTHVENWLRDRGGLPPYAGGFVNHYLLSHLFPNGIGYGGEVVLG